jgi:hypothetical protein
MVGQAARPQPGASTWYRNDTERARSVYRRANPWHRRLLRGLIGLTLATAVGTGLYVGAREIQDVLERDQLPPPGVEVPRIASTSLVVTSTAPAPAVDGTVTFDTTSLAFEFVGRVGGPQSGLQIISPDGSSVYVRSGDSPWRESDRADEEVSGVLTAVRYLADDDSADDILTNRLRRGFVELLLEVTEGVGDDRLVRYELNVDTRAFARDFPLQWQAFRDDAVPGAQLDSEVPLTIWLDPDGTLVRVRDRRANWAWERLTSSDEPFRPVDPSEDAEPYVAAEPAGDGEAGTP